MNDIPIIIPVFLEHTLVVSVFQMGYAGELEHVLVVDTTSPEANHLVYEVKRRTCS